jgi:predicted nuclease with RNAse H fold
VTSRPDDGAGARRAMGVDVGLRRFDAVLLVDGALADDPVAFTDAADLTGLLARWRPQALAIDSPPAWAAHGHARACEQELLRRGINLYRTPPEAASSGSFYGWMRSGIELFAVAAANGYPLGFDPAAAAGHALEVFPHAVAVALRGELPPPGVSRDPRRKRRWRQAVLDDHGVDTGSLRTGDMVDAALAALCADRALQGTACGLGMPGEGVIVLPVPEARERYHRGAAEPVDPPLELLDRTAVGAFPPPPDDPRDPALQALLDRQAIADVVARYVRGVDRLDRDLVRSCYHPDATDEHGSFSGGVDAYVDWAFGLLRRYDTTMHLLGPTLVELAGDVALAETYGVAHHRAAPDDDGAFDAKRNLVTGFRYVDRFERRDGTWRIAKRIATTEWSRVDDLAGWWSVPDHLRGGRRDGQDPVYWLVPEVGRDGGR